MSTVLREPATTNIPTRLGLSRFNLAASASELLFRHPSQIQNFTRPGEEREFIRIVRDAGYIETADKLDDYLEKRPQIFPRED